MTDSETMTAAEIAEMRAQVLADAVAALELDTVKDIVVERGVITEAVVIAPKFPVNPNSIRQTIMTALLRGESTKQIAAVLVERFPDTAAARKSVIHIAFYRSKMRKAGLLPKAGQ